jgi:Family of unknown function (DUF6876)
MAQFRGTEHWYQHPLAKSLTYTDGAKYIADTAGAYWLLDQIALSYRRGKLKHENFQVWKLEVDELTHRGYITVDDGNGNVLRRKMIALTDFPKEGVTLWCVENVIMLPSEY